MTNRFWPGIVLLLMLTGCGSGGTPTRENDFTPLTSIEITAVSPAIAEGTSTKITAMGNFSGLFTRDITSKVVWTSSRPDVADFTKAKDHVTSKTAGVATLTATLGNVTASYNLTVTTATIVDMTITPDSPSVPNGQTQPFKATGTFSDTTTQDMTFDAKWSSSIPAVATVSDVVSSKGLATALSLGSTSISASFGGKSKSTTLTVITPILQSIVVTTDNSTILSLSKAVFKATGTYSDGSTADITTQVSWSSSQPAIATIDSTSGAAKTLAPGTAQISATLGDVSGTTNLKVTGGKLTAIAVSAVNPLPLTNPDNLVQGTLAQITATGTFDNGTKRDITGAVDWSVANTAIATVTAPAGNVAFVKTLAVTSTPTTVSAKSGSVTGVTNLTVTNPTLQTITIDPASLDLAVGSSGRFKVTGTFSDNTKQDLTASAFWSTSATTTATVVNTADNTDLSKGRISGIAASTTPITITAAYGSLPPPTVTVTVNPRTVESLTINGLPSSFAPGTQAQLTLIAKFTDNSTQDVTEDAAWTIDNKNVVILADSQNHPVQILAVDSGTATLTASFREKSLPITLTVP